MPFELTILGASGAIPAYGRFTSAQYLNINNHHFLVDCGEGVQLQLAKTSVSIHRISHIFISHLHGDHYLGLMGLLFTMHLNHRETDLHLYSHRGLDEIILTQLRHSHSVLRYQLHFHELTPGKNEVIFENDYLTIESFPLMHRLACSGFIFREKPKPRRIDKDRLPVDMKLQYIAQLKLGNDIHDDDGKLLYKNEDYTLPPRPSFSYAYCSDTAIFPELTRYIKDVDVLYHEATFMEEERDKASETFHSTASDAARVAQMVHAKKLLIGHYSARYRELDGLLAEARAIFPNTELAIDLNTIEVKS
ncbi:MAG TPA: ribonuclease Z [Cyclobacteriaceae bacterium]|nr:ribonuclease Z [Cyclobacteriaceae bacterium]